MISAENQVLASGMVLMTWFYGPMDDQKRAFIERYKARVEKAEAQLREELEEEAKAHGFYMRKFPTELDSGRWIIAKRSMFLVFLMMLFAASSFVVTRTEFGHR